MLHKSRLAILSIALLSSSIGAARAAGLDETAILQAVEKVVAEHKVYATCHSLDALSLRLVQQNWSREVGQGAEALKALKPSAALVARYLVATDSARLLDKGMTLSAAMAYCEKNHAQVTKFEEFAFSRLAIAIDTAAKLKPKP